VSKGESGESETKDCRKGYFYRSGMLGYQKNWETRKSRKSSDRSWKGFHMGNGEVVPCTRGKKSFLQKGFDNGGKERKGGKREIEQSKRLKIFP